jgi:hypothetical protein
MATMEQKKGSHFVRVGSKVYELLLEMVAAEQKQVQHGFLLRTSFCDPSLALFLPCARSLSPPPLSLPTSPLSCILPCSQAQRTQRQQQRKEQRQESLRLGTAVDGDSDGGEEEVGDTPWKERVTPFALELDDDAQYR